MIEKTIEHFFKEIDDPRHHNRLHKLIDIIIISICAVISGADTYDQIETFGNVRKSWLSKFLELPNGIPSHDTFGRVLEKLNPIEFQNSFMKWIASVSKQTKGKVIAIDGKTLRRSHDHANDKKAIHMISAWAESNNVVLGQLKTSEKSNEITAIPTLLNLLDISGSIITIDAMGTQKQIVQTIIENDADYVLALKENHKTFHDEVVRLFDHQEKMMQQGYSFDECTTVDGDHGRVETRKYTATSDLGWFEDKSEWKGLNSLCMVESIREIGGKVSQEKRYYISSLECDAQKIGKAIRSHWGIENSVHWILDMAFREDESRIRKGYGAENFAAIRNIALNLLKTNKTFKGSIKTKRLRATMDPSYLKEVVFG